MSRPTVVKGSTPADTNVRSTIVQGRLSERAKLRQGNDLIRACGDLKLQEKRLVAAAITRVRQHAIGLENTDFYNLGFQGANVRITASEYADLYQVSRSVAYRQMRESTRSLIRRYVTLHPSSSHTVHINWISRGSYHDDEGWCEIALTPDILAHSAMIETFYAEYALSRAAQLQSKYSWSLYELMAMFKRTGKLDISVNEFCDAMAVPGTYRKNFALLRDKVITPAITDINDNLNLGVSYKAEKSGRSYSRLVFKFKRETQKSLF